MRSSPAGRRLSILGFAVLALSLGSCVTRPCPDDRPCVFPARGFYDTSVTVSIQSPHSGSTLRYTLDGSEPSLETGTIYEGRLVIGPGRAGGAVPLRVAAFAEDGSRTPTSTHSYVFPAAVLRQPKAGRPGGGPGLPARVLARRVAEVDPGMLLETARWGDFRAPEDPIRVDVWRRRMAAYPTEYFPYRTQVVQDQISNLTRRPKSDP